MLVQLWGGAIGYTWKTRAGVHFTKNKGLGPGLVTPIVSLRSTLSALRAVEMAVARLPSRDFLALSRTLFFFYVWLEPRGTPRIKGLRADPSRLEVTRTLLKCY